MERFTEPVEYVANVIKDQDQFYTINERQPKILRRAADHFLKDYKKYLAKKEVALSEQELAEADEDAKKIYKSIYDYSEKPPANTNIERITDDYPDARLWNLRLLEYVRQHRKQPNYLDTSTLWAETYIYRSLASIFFKSKYFKEYDAFDQIKQDGLLRQQIAATKLIEHTAGISERVKAGTDTPSTSTVIATEPATEKTEFATYLRFALWGNKFDLSCSHGYTNTDDLNLFNDLKNKEPLIICNPTNALFEHFKTNKIDTLTIVADNSGYELLGDLCFVEMLYQTGLIDENCKIIWHLKKFPWFVSDTLEKDFIWLLNCLLTQFDSEIAKQMSQRWSKFLNDSKWELKSHLFWTTPYVYPEMQRIAPDLYEELTKSQLVIFKGDLNYRKLISDYVWPRETPFEQALKGFFPTNIATLRTVKCRPLVDVPPHKEKMLQVFYWTSGNYGTMHFYKKK